uniref:Peptidase S1 domain-containing protein n=1 Tax=Heterorhabditis bacteriophora TaxID=37862 RepID=A0A1I7XT84_HETBA
MDVEQVLPENRLIGGVETDPHTWPWTVQLLYKGTHRCGGALIDSQFVLTAAHCFARSRLPEMYSIHIGGHKSGGGNPHQVQNISTHFLFNVVWPSSYDIAILRLANPFSLHPPFICSCMRRTHLT